MRDGLESDRPLPDPDPFEFDYCGRALVYGRGRLERLNALLADRGLDDAMIVCGSNVGSNDELMGPVRRHLGDRLVAVFDETTSVKAIETVYDGLEVMAREDPDVLIGLGGGSSLDIARQMSVFAADDRSLADVRRAAAEGDLNPPRSDGSTTPVVVIPTTFAGADLSSGGSVTVLSAAESPTGHPIRTGGSVWPTAMLYDPALFETTPSAALSGSAMNGFNKGIETIYSGDSTPITDATATRGIRLLRETLPRLHRGEPTVMDRAVVGLVLAQFERRGSIVHAVGHGFARRYPIQQGVVHAVVTPHVLRYVFRSVDGDRHRIASALGIDTDDRSETAVAAAIVDEIEAVRDSLDLPSRLRDIDAVDERDFPAIAAFVLEDDLLEQVPDSLDPTAAEIESILRSAW